MKIVWDERKRLTNLDKHGMEFADLTVEFFQAATIYSAKRNRSLALGAVAGVSMVAVIFAPLGKEAISVISMRKAGVKERKLK